MKKEKIVFKSPAEELLLKAKNPAEFIDLSYKLKIKGGRKAYIAKHWLAKKKLTVDVLKYARNRHPYWKERKMEGTAERNKQRCIDYNYGSGERIFPWPTEMIKEFIKLNKKKKDGKYLIHDREIARILQISIPSVQSYRRKVNLISRIHGTPFEKLSTTMQIMLLRQGETKLRKQCKKKK